MATKPLFVQARKSFLTAPITNSDNSLVLSAFTDVYGNALAMSDFGSIGYLTISPGGEDEEIISFTGITQNSDGTATITGLVRGLNAKSTYASGGTASNHSAGSIVVASDNPQVLQAIIAYIDAVSIAGAANASDILQGLVQIATAAQITSGTRTGSTGAVLAMSPDQLALSIFGTRLPSQAQKDALGGTAKTPSTNNFFPTLQDVDAFTSETDQSQGTQNSSTAVGEANATTKHSLISQKFVVGTNVQRIKGARLYKSADTGSFTGTVKVALQADSSGNPSGSDLASFTISNAAWLKISTGEFEIAFSTEYASLTPGGTYHLVVSCSTNDTANHPNLGVNTAGGYASGVLKFNNSTDGWVTISTTQLYFKTTHGVLSRTIKTDSTEGLLPLELRPYSIIDVDATASNVINSTTETVVYSKMMRGGLLSLNAGLRFLINVAATNVSSNFNGTVGLSIKIKYNGSILATISAASAIGDATNGIDMYSTIEAIILNNNSQSSQKIFGRVASSSVKSKAGTPTLAQLTSAWVQPPVNTTTAIDLSQPGLLEITTTLSTAGSGAARSDYYGLIIEKIAA